MASLPKVIFNFGVQNENSGPELRVIDELASRHGTGIKAAVIASSGSHALAMASTRKLAELHLVDVSLAQLHLCRLHFAAARVLSPADFGLFVGLSGTAADRAPLVSRVLSALEGDVSQQFWRDNDATLTAGVVKCGGAERMYRLVREHIGLTETTPWSEVVAKADRVRSAFPEVGTIDTWLSTTVDIPRPVAEMLIASGAFVRIGQDMARALVEHQTPDPIQQFILTGSFAADRLPFFLREETLSVHQLEPSVLPAIFYHHGPVQEVMVKADQKVDLLSLSNIMDWFPPPVGTKVLSDMRATIVKPGGAIILRWSGVPRDMGRVIVKDAGFKIDEELSAIVTALETSPVIADTIVAFA